jgi:isopenicillin-N N-acyltransferase-like protein
MNALLAERYGRLTVEDLQAILADHSNFPAAICRHPRAADGSTEFVTAGVTVASIIAEPERGLLHVAPGNPCQNALTTYALDA